MVSLGRLCTLTRLWPLLVELATVCQVSGEAIQVREPDGLLGPALYLNPSVATIGRAASVRHLGGGPRSRTGWSAWAAPYPSPIGSRVVCLGRPCPFTGLLPLLIELATARQLGGVLDREPGGLLGPALSLHPFVATADRYGNSAAAGLRSGAGWSA
ncbi:hypothetical protein J6590_050208 [Homalodisca vitripennis]|nr:hypothetical protein J6590_050208 [Homalodisca vitripennis]